MEKKNGIESKDAESARDTDTKLKDRHAPAPDSASKTPKKRRKVNHGEFVLPPYATLFPPPFLQLRDFPGDQANARLRVSTACVYCRRSVSSSLTHFNTEGAQLLALRCRPPYLMAANYCS